VYASLIAVSETCPPPGFDSVQHFNLSAFIEAPWFVLSQVRWPSFVERSVRAIFRAMPILGLQPTQRGDTEAQNV